MENQQIREILVTGQGTSGPPEDKGYDTPGQDTIIQSTSSAVPSPSQTSKDRLQTPKPVIETIGQEPGNANPARDETIGFEQGQMSTADLLRAREFAEEEFARSSGKPQQYQDQGQDQGNLASAQEFEEKDAGRPTPASLMPDDRQQAPLEYMESPRANEPLLSGAPEVLGGNIEGRQDRAVDSASTEASKAESNSGLPSVGFDAEEDIYQRREMQTPSEPSDLNRIAPGMPNVPPDNGQ
jgi:hypothetical protein